MIFPADSLNFSVDSLLPISVPSLTPLLLALLLRSARVLNLSLFTGSCDGARAWPVTFRRESREGGGAWNTSSETFPSLQSPEAGRFQISDTEKRDT